MENEIIVGVVIALVSALVGWAISQLTVGNKTIAAINRMELSIERVSNDAHRAQDEVKELRIDVTQRNLAMHSLVEKVLETADKLIEVVRVQSALLEQKQHD